MDESPESVRRSGDHHSGRYGWPNPAPSMTLLGEIRAIYSAWCKENEHQRSSRLAFFRRIPRSLYPSFPKPIPQAGALRNQATRFGRSWCYGGSSCRSYTRDEVKALKKDLKEAADAFKEGAKFFKTFSDEMRAELEKLKKMVEEYSSMVKAGLDAEVANMNISRENAALLKNAVDELKEAIKASNAGKSFKVTNYHKLFRIPGLKACKNLSYFVAIGTAVLIATGYFELGEPVPFNPRNTKAGKLLYDDFQFGLEVSCTSSLSPTDTITSMLSGELDALQSHVMVNRIQEYWKCEIGIAPGNDVVIKAGMVGICANGLKVDANLPFYDGVQRKLDFKLKHCFGSIGGTVGLNSNPVLRLNTMFGGQKLSCGLIFDYDLVPGILRRVGVGGAFNLFGLSATVMMEKIFNPHAAVQQPPQPVVRHQISSTVHLQTSKSTFVAAELKHSLEESETTLAIGVEHQVDSVTSVKGRLTNQGLLSGLMRYKLTDKAVVSFTGMVNLTALQAVPRVGFSLSFAP